MNFILDEEIVLQNKKGNLSDNDLLNAVVYVESLQNTIESADVSKKPFTIGLFGEWGSGKSSIVKTVQQRLKKNKNVDYKFICYDAWKYVGDSFRRMFLLELQQQLGVNPSEKLRLFYDNINEDKKVVHKTNTSYIWVLFILVLFLMLLIILGDKVGLQWSLGITTFISFISLLVTIQKSSVDDLKVTVQKSRLFAPEQFEECFKEIILASKKKNCLCRNAKKWVEGTRVKCDKLVIVIDNIDRCHHEMAYSLLTDIKNFLGNQKDVIFLIPVDVDALRKHILIRDGLNFDEANKDADEFLRKFFNVSIWIKPYHTDEMYEFARSINEKYKVGLQPITLSVIANEFATNPRRVIQLFNNLIVELQSYDEYFVRNHQPLICQLVIVREEFPEFYQQIQRNPTLLFSLEKLDKDYFEKKGNIRLKLFLERTFYISKRYEFDLSIVDKILSNSCVSNSLPDNIKEIILIPGHGDEILDYISGQENKRKEVVSYILSSIRKAIDRDLVDADMINYYPAYLDLVAANIIKEDDSRAFANLMQRDVLWDRLLRHIPDYLTQHIDYAHSLHKINNYQLTDRYIEYVNLWKVECDEKVNYKKIRNSIYYACSSLGPSSVEKLQDAFIRAYKDDPVVALSYRYLEPRILFTEEFLKGIIDEMSVDNISDENSPYKQLLSIFKQIEPKGNESYILVLLDKLETMVPSYDRSNNKEVILPLLSFIRDILVNNQKLVLSETDHLSSLIGRITEKSNNANTSCLKANVDDKDVYQLAIDLFKLASLSTKNAVVSPSAVLEIIHHPVWKEVMIGVLNELLLKKFDVSYYKDSITSVNVFNKEHFNLLSYLLSDDCPEERRMDAKTIEKLIPELIGALTSQDENRVCEFIEKILIFEQVRSSMLRYLELQPIELLEQMPEQLQAFVVTKFEEDIDRYENNLSILSLIASLGSSKSVSIICKMINAKLSTSGKETMAIDLMERLRIINLKDFNMLKGTLSNDSIVSVNAERRDNLINQLQSKCKD